MPKISADRLRHIASKLLQGAGASLEEATIIAKHSIASNLGGHDSHGIIQIPKYIEQVKANDIIPGAPFDIVQESATTTVVDGNWGFGYVVSERAMALTIEKARKQNVAATTVYRQSHVGRLTDYPVMAAEAGMIAMMTADSGRAAKAVVPFGGREPRLGTNPICMAMPSNLPAPLFIDIATSAVAGGKIGVAAARNEPIPEGWILDGDGSPVTDPSAPRKGGGLLPLGGPEGHKGYGLSVMVEIFSGILTGLGFGHDPAGRHNDGVFMATFNVEAFRPLESFKQEVTEFASYLKSSPPAQGFTEVFYPGELEHRKSEQLLVEGITVEDATWERLKTLALEFSIAAELDML